MSSSTPEIPQAYIETAQDLADIARQSTLSLFRKPIQIDQKHDTSPVTIADRNTEQSMRELIENRHPDHGIFGEEFGRREGSSDWFWVLDPIDGTKSFICGKPIFGSLIALLHEDKPMVGVVEIPAQGERWLGISNSGTRLDGNECNTSSVKRVSEAAMLSTTPDMFNTNEWALFDRISRTARIRNFGTDCYGYGLLASGFADIVMEASLQPYDYMALIPVVEGAGGVVSDWNGSPLGMNSDGKVIACATRELHKELLELIANSGQK